MKKSMRLTFTVIGVLVVLVIVMIFIYGPAFRRFNVSSIESLDPLLTVWLGAGGNSMVLRSEVGQERNQFIRNLDEPWSAGGCLSNG